MISPQEAWSHLEQHLEVLSSETRPRPVSDRVLARDVPASTDVPALDVSAMDGYALGIGHEDGATLDVDGVVAAGDAPGTVLREGAALRIMTGAPVPRGTDRVVPIEETDGGRERVVVSSVGSSGQHIRRCGEVVRAGDPMLRAGTWLTPGAAGLLASQGIAELEVVRRPTLAMVTTGDEVVPADREPGPGQLRDSHSDFFATACAPYCERVDLLGIAPDRPEALRELIEKGRRCDVLLLTGGVSMGEFDLVEAQLRDAGCRTLFDSVAIQPGKPMVAAVHDGGFVFGLPGNPASAMVTFWLFVRPVLRRLQGLRDGYWQDALRGELTAPLPGAKGRDRFLPAAVDFAEGRLLVRPFPPEGSHDVAAYAVGTSLVRIPARSEPAEPGAPCEVLPLVDWPRPAI